MKVPKKYFNLFRREVKRWVEQFGLSEWELRFFQEDIRPSLATIVTDLRGRIAVFRYPTHWEDPLELTEALVKASAKHEAIELLVEDLATLAGCAYKTEEEVRTANHTLVRRLERLIP